MVLPMKSRSACRWLKFVAPLLAYSIFTGSLVHVRVAFVRGLRPPRFDLSSSAYAGSAGWARTGAEPITTDPLELDLISLGDVALERNWLQTDNKL